ncbi:hypothetical protein KKF05_01500 [Patescibacteria group bacterium]|nr:hypothetical protein [Patescibacteria group bacterium]
MTDEKTESQIDPPLTPAEKFIQFATERAHLRDKKLDLRINPDDPSQVLLHDPETHQLLLGFRFRKIT